jgi:hypothetical protein
LNGKADDEKAIHIVILDNLSSPFIIKYQKVIADSTPAAYCRARTLPSHGRKNRLLFLLRSAGDGIFDGISINLNLYFIFITVV